MGEQPFEHMPVILAQERGKNGANPLVPGVSYMLHSSFLVP